MAEARRILFISNGLGEDSVGAEIVKRLPVGIAAEAYPTLGAGHAYDGVCAVVGPRAELKSQGSRIAKGTVAADIASGGLMTIPPGLAFMRKAGKRYDHVVVIGDFIGVAGCWLSGLRGITYLDVYKTGYGRPYSWIERQIIRATCRRVFTRSERLAATLVADGVDARVAGNVMMDTITAANYDARSRRSRSRAVTLLPGSRERTAENFALQIAALRTLSTAERPDVFLGLAGGIDAGELAAAANLIWSPGAGGPDAGSFTDGVLKVHAASGAVRNLVEASDVVLSQAGTATIQALGLGRPVITFVREGDRMKRFLEENLLFGDARLIVPDRVQELAGAMRKLLADPAELARLGAIGGTRIGGPGAIDAIIAAIA